MNTKAKGKFYIVTCEICEGKEMVIANNSRIAEHHLLKEGWTTIPDKEPEQTRYICPRHKVQTRHTHPKERRT